jgi:hypothetical protein
MSTPVRITTPCHHAALTHAFLVVLYATTGHPRRSELAYVRLLSHLVLHAGTGDDWRSAS